MPRVWSSHSPRTGAQGRHWKVGSHLNNPSGIKHRMKRSQGSERWITEKIGVGTFWKKRYIVACMFILALLWIGVRLYHRHFSVSRISNTDLGTDKATTGWEGLSNRVAFAIKTGREVIEERFPNPNSTWLQRVTNYLVVSDVADARYSAVGLKEMFESLGISWENFLENRQPPLISTSSSQRKPLEVTVDQTKNGWWQDREKNLPGFYTLWKKFPSMDWYIMCDDDTFFFLDGLAAILQHPIFQQAMKEEVPIYMGNQFNVALCEGYDPSGMTNGTLNPWFAHGGSGIILNYWALEALIDMIPWCMYRFQDCWAGDIKVGLCFRETGIEVVPMGTHFIAVDPKSYFDTYFSQPPYKQSKAHDTVASFHHCDDEEFAFLYSLQQKVKQEKRRLVQFKDIAEIVSPSFHFP